MPLTYSVPEAAALLRISRGLAYEAVRRGEIPSIRVGRRRLVPVAALHDLLSEKSRQPEARSHATTIPRAFRA